MKNLITIAISIAASIALVAIYHATFNGPSDIPLGFVKRDSTMVFVGFTDKPVFEETYARDTVVMKNGAGGIIRDSITKQPIFEIKIDTTKAEIQLDSISYVDPVQAIEAVRVEQVKLSRSIFAQRKFDEQVVTEFNKMLTRIEKIDPGGKIK